MFSEEQIERIKLYGKLSYNNGYKEGFTIGVLLGSLLGFTVVVSSVIISRHK